MLRTFTLLVYFLFSLLGAYPAIAQSYPNMPARIIVSSSVRTLSVGQSTEIRITLINQQGLEIAAAEDTPITLIGTKLKDLNSAKGEAQESKTMHHRVLELPPGRISTVQGSLTIPSGHSAAIVHFRSQQSGTIRIFAESEKLVAGSTLIAVLRESSGMSAAQTSAFQTVSFQEESAPASYALTVEDDGNENPPIVNQQWVHTINVTLRLNGEPVRAKEQIDIRLRTKGGSGTLSNYSPIIPPGEASTADIELRTPVGGDIKVFAEAVQGQTSIASALSLVKFPKARQATRLLVDAMPSAALANGLDGIQLRVRAVDDGNNPIRAEEERLPARDVVFRLEGTGSGLKFDQGITKLTIPKNEMEATIHVFGSSPINGIKIIAESENGVGAAINGATKVAFSFPWWQLWSAIFGGLLVPPLCQLKKARLKLADLVKNTLIGSSVVGAVCGGIFFVVIFYGAAVVDGLNVRGLTLNLTRLPIQNVVAAFVIGILGGLLINKMFFTASIPADKLKEVSSGLPSV